jgi:hypothetical protein
MIYRDNISEKEFLKLAETRGVCLSIYFNCSRTINETHLDQLILRQLTKEAFEQVSYQVDKENEFKKIEIQINELTLDEDFWFYKGYSLAILVNKNQFLTYRLPYQVKNSSKVSDRFYILPLLPSLNLSNAYVLAISQKNVTLYQYMDNEELNIVDVPNLPLDIVQYNGRILQRNSVADSKLRDGTGKKVLQLQFIRAIEKVVKNFISSSHMHLILATTEEFISFYQSVNCYSLLSKYTIIGSVENVLKNDLTQSAKNVLLKKNMCHFLI